MNGRGLDKARIAEFEQKIGDTFQDTALLVHALSHTSYTNEHGMEKQASNERLEFLGDAIVDMVVSDYLYRHNSTEPEGTLTKWRASVVCEASFAHIAAGMDYGSYLLLGKGEEATGGRSRSSVLADAFEAVIAAMYLDSNIETVSEWIIRHLQEELTLAMQGKMAKDYKTLLQELVQKGERGKVSYVITDEKGPDHAKTFCVDVLVDGERAASGSGTSKKDAEQAAAGAAIKAITKKK